MCECCDVPLSQSAVQQWKVKGQVERVLWNHFQPDLLLVSRQEGEGGGGRGIFSLGGKNTFFQVR